MSKRTFGLVVSIVAVLVVLDFLPYRDCFRRFHDPAEVSDLEEAYTFIAADEDRFRTLAYEGYNPFQELGRLYCSKPRAWTWLNWTASKYTGEFALTGIFPLLYHGRGDARALERGLILAGLGNVKYIIDDSEIAPHTGGGSALESVKSAGRFTVYRNPRWRPYVQRYGAAALYIGTSLTPIRTLIPELTARGIALVHGRSLYLEDFSEGELGRFDYIFLEDVAIRERDAFARVRAACGDRIVDLRDSPSFSIEAPPATPPEEVLLSWQRPRPEEISIELSHPNPGWIAVSESFYPGWTAELDGSPAEILRVNHCFQGMRVEGGRHRLRFAYTPPPYYRWGYWISVVFFAAGGVLLLFGRRVDGLLVK